MKSPWEGGTKGYINGPGQITKMATMPVYSKKHQKIFYRTNSPVIMKLAMDHYVLKLYKIYINDDPELTLTHFKTMSSLANFVFVLIGGPDIR